MKNKLKVHVVVQFNTGTRVHKPKKGKGSYKRKREKIVVS